MHADTDEYDALRPSQNAPAAACAELLFRALVETDGDAALLHTGGAPQLITPIGRIELVKSSLTVPAVEQLLSRLLPDAARERARS